MRVEVEQSIAMRPLSSTVSEIESDARAHTVRAYESERCTFALTSLHYTFSVLCSLR
jgi:hypothetical protein